MTSPQPDHQPSNPRMRAWPLFFLLLALEGLFIVVTLAGIAADPKNALVFGFSLRRLAVMGAALFLAGGFTFLGAKSWRDAAWRGSRLDPTLNLRLAPSLSIFSIVLILLSWAVLFFMPFLWGENTTLRAFYERFQPLLVWFCWIGLQVLLWLAWLRFEALAAWLRLFARRLSSDRKVFAGVGVAWLALMAAWGLVALTKIGLVRDAGGWGAPGVPLLEGQILTVLLAGLLLLAVGLLLQRRAKPAGASAGRGRPFPWLDLGLVLIIWLAAAYLWVNQPYQALSYFAPKERPPNFEVYPSSDAALYDFVAQNILVGNGYLNGRVITRPLYILFLAGLHAAAGQNYDSVVSLQQLFLALFPVVLYLLGKSLHSRLAGMIMAALAVWRELNAIQTIPLVAVSNSKLFMSDLPTALCISLIVLLVVRWLKIPVDDPPAGENTPSKALRWANWLPFQGKTWMPQVIGGAIGLTMLIRTQTVLLAPFILLLALVVYRRAWLQWIKASLLLGLGILLAVSPWLYRNWASTGMVLFEQPLETRYLAQMYTSTPSIPPEPNPGENDVAYAQRLSNGIKTFALQNPGVVAGFTAAHFVNNEIDALLVFPQRTKPILELDEAFNIREAFWWKWDGSLKSWGNGLLMLLCLTLVAVGIGAGWKVFGAAGLAPLVIHLGYALSNAVTRNSGSRLMLPVDWVSYFYVAIGLVQVAVWMIKGSGVQPRGLLQGLIGISSPSDGVAPQSAPAWKGGLICLCIFMLGASLPLSEKLIPKYYPLQGRAELVQQLLSLPSVKKSGLDLQALEKFAMQDNVIVSRGRVLYPKFYAGADGEPGNGWAIFEERPYPRLGFQLIGRDNRGVILPILQPPSFFPNAADAIVVGCRAEDHTTAALVAILGKKDATYLRANVSAPECIISN